MPTVLSRMAMCEVKDKEKTYKVEKSIYDKLDIGETYKVKADSEEIVSIIEQRLENAEAGKSDKVVKVW